jgi:hypothetical protein
VWRIEPPPNVGTSAKSCRTQDEPAADARVGATGRDAAREQPDLIAGHQQAELARQQQPPYEAVADRLAGRQQRPRPQRVGGVGDGARTTTTSSRDG